MKARTLFSWEQRTPVTCLPFRADVAGVLEAPPQMDLLGAVAVADRWVKRSTSGRSMKKILSSPLGWAAICLTAFGYQVARAQPVPPAPSSEPFGSILFLPGFGEADAEEEPPLIEVEPEIEVNRTPETIDHARQTVKTALLDSTQYSRLDRSSRTLQDASEALRFRPRQTIALAERVLEVPQETPVEQRALWLIAEAHRERGDLDDALETFERIDGTPVDDHLELRRLELMLEEGRADEVVPRAEALVDATVGTNSWVIHGAREMLIRSLYETDQWEEFIRVGERFSNRYPEYTRRDQLILWLGQAELALGNAEAAARRFDQVHWEFPYRQASHPAWVSLQALIAVGIEPPHHSFDERFERLRLLRRNKHWSYVDLALEDLLEDASQVRGQGSFCNEIRLDRARNAYGRGDFQAALTHLDEISEHDSQGIRHHTLMTWYADVYERLRRYEEGAEAIRRRDRGRSTVRQHLELGEYYYENGFHEEAIQHFEEVRPLRRQDDWEHTLLVFAAGQYDRAAVQFEDLAEHNHGRDRRKFRYWQARALQEAGDMDEAIEWFTAVHEDWPRTYYGLQAENRLYEIERNLDIEMVAAAESEETPVPVEEGAEEGHTIQDLADGLMRELDFGLTQLVAQQLPDMEIPDRQPEVFSAPARVHWDGPEGVADTHLSFATSDHIIDGAYVSTPDVVAFHSLADNHGDLFPALERSAFLLDVGQWRDSWEESREASLEYRSLRSRFNRRRPTVQRPLTLSRDLWAHYIDNRSIDTGHWGIRLGPDRWNIPDDNDLAAEYGARQVQIWERRDELREAFTDGLMALGDAHFVRRFARERGGYRGSAPDGERQDDWSQAYARAYPEMVTDAAARHGVNPYVIWSLMTVESSYNPDSISRANARGLLQVIPKTGELISQRLGLWDFGPHNLMNPELSIEFGCYYIGELLEKFHGQELLAFAGYNGGPHNVARWVEANGDLPLDLFVELIPFREAREYSKKVYRHLALYRMIYMSEYSLYIGQDIDPVYESNIHF